MRVRLLQRKLKEIPRDHLELHGMCWWKHMIHLVFNVELRLVTNFIDDNVLVLHETKRINQPLTFRKCVNNVTFY